eukprot:jgi/Psemu1/2290/gm1.2290_g
MPSTDDSSKEMVLAILKLLQELEFAKSSKALEKEILKRFSLKILPSVLTEKVLTLQPIKKPDDDNDDEVSDDISTSSDSSSGSSSSSSSDEESEAEAKKSKAAASKNDKPKENNKKKVETATSSESGSDSDSGNDSDSDSSSSSSESEKDEPPKKKAKTTNESKSKKETEVVTPEDSSDSDNDSDSDVSDVEVSSVSTVSSDDDSDSDSDSDSSSSSSDSDSSEDEDLEAIQKARRKKAAEKAKQAAEAALAWTPKKIKKSASDIKIEAGTDGAQALSAGKPFQRVDDSFWGEKAMKDGGAMADNSYENVFGGDGFGAKSSEKLLQVRGKRFQHEKTKRKRSFNGMSRTGGKINMESNSTKYKYDD